MKLVLDFNAEIYPLEKDESFSLVLASSLSGAAGPTGEGAEGGDGDEKERDVWRPDGKGRKGLEEEYEYVMYGKVSRPIHESGSAYYLVSGVQIR